jgi:CubicO group peptidase (beta-lactamase class C family)
MRLPTLLLIQLLAVRSALAQNGSLEQLIDKCVEPYVKANNFAGTVYLAKSGKVLYEKSFGNAIIEANVPNANNTKYHLASVSKPFTSTAILILEQQGKLSTTDPVSKYLPDFTEGNKITLHHLLSHTSGVVNINDFPEYNLWSLTPMSLDSIVKSFQKKPLLFEPGSKYSYSNSNYNVLAYIIERVSGMKYGDFLKKYIFDEVEMKNTRHHGNAQDIIQNVATGYMIAGRTDLQRAPYLDWTIKTGNGSLYSTVEDLAKFERSFFTEKILTKATKEKMFTPNLSEVGYGWYLKSHINRKRSYITGRSPGFSTYLARYPDDEVCVVVLSNLYIPSTKEIGERVASIVFKEPYVRRTLNDEPLNTEETKQFTGTYQFGADFFRPNFKMEFTEINGRLACSFGDLIRDGRDEFILRGFWSVIHFDRDPSQKIVGLSFDGIKAARVQPQD